MSHHFGEHDYARDLALEERERRLQQLEDEADRDRDLRGSGAADREPEGDYR